MTNLIGMALVVLNASIVTNYFTNQVPISCEQAGCTNWSWGKAELLDDNGVWNAKKGKYEYESHSEKIKMCMYLHLTNQVLPEVEITTYTIGVSNQPLFEIIKLKGLEGNGKYQCRYFNDGVYLREKEK